MFSARCLLRDVQSTEGRTGVEGTGVVGAGTGNESLLSPELVVSLVRWSRRPGSRTQVS